MCDTIHPEPQGSRDGRGAVPAAVQTAPPAAGPTDGAQNSRRGGPASVVRVANGLDGDTRSHNHVLHGRAGRSARREARARPPKRKALARGGRTQGHRDAGAHAGDAGASKPRPRYSFSFDRGGPRAPRWMPDAECALGVRRSCRARRVC